MDVRSRIDSLAKRFRLDAMYAFGSRAREVLAFVTGTAALGEGQSDVDIGILPKTGIHLHARDRVDLVLGLEELFEGARVDLVVLPEAPPFLAVDIVSGELIFVEDRYREAEYQLYVLRRAGDLAPFERERRAIILAGGR